jgi:hypothetical protein
MFKGNKIRFINEPPHNDRHKEMLNCFPKALLCNSVVRLAIYADKDLRAGDELFFSYGEKYVE